ncbi:MAG: exonuclease subunit SbcD [Bacteroidota bacterium]
MKLLHTADWHLGKRLDHVSRLEEQRAVMEEICIIAEKEEVDAVLIAGDLFDHINPSIEATELLYRTLKRLASDGQRAVIGIAGNHDSPDRIEAPDPLARECGIVLLGYPHSAVKPFALESGLAVSRSAPGFLELNLPNHQTPLRIIATPYANEVRLRRYLGVDKPESALREVLEENWKTLAEQYCDEHGVNILMAHLFVMAKGTPRQEEPEDEKPILTIGGAQEIYTENLPSGIQYGAFGHLHRYQIVSDTPYPVVYSSSPLAYSMSEAGQEKGIVLIEAQAGEKVSFQKIPLREGKPLARQTFHSIEEAIVWLKEHPSALVELTLVSETFLNATDRKRLHQAHNGILTIIPRISDPSLTEVKQTDIDLSRNMQDLFIDYFKHKHQGQEPPEELMNLFREILAADPEE